MESTVIAILLASAVVFWNAPFAVYLVPVNRMLQRHWRHILFVILLLLLIASQTHTTPTAMPVAPCQGQAYVAACVTSPQTSPMTTLKATASF